MSLYDHKISIVNGDTQDVSGPVTFIRLHATTGPLKIDINGKRSEMVAGNTHVFDVPVKRFQVVNESGAAVDATFKLGHAAEFRDNNLSGTIGVVQPTTIDTVADVALGAAATTLVLAADPSRREALISNLIGNASAIRVGDVNAGAARGVQVGTGQTVTIAGTEAIYAYSATAQSVGVTTVKD